MIVPLAVVLLSGCAAAAPPQVSTPQVQPSAVPPTVAVSPTAAAVGPALTWLEREYDARLGVFAIDTGSGAVVAHRDGERFAYASTLKALAVGALLASSTSADLDRVVAYTSADLVAFSPVTGPRVGTPLTLMEVAEAAVVRSDNTAANLVLRELGGPAVLQDALRRGGDRVTRVDRLEPDLNDALPGDDRDTSSPRALATGLRELVVGDALAVDDRELLSSWLRVSTTGSGLVRAAVPDDWEVGDKSGTGGYGTRNDLAVVRPPGRAPLVIAVLSTHDDPDAEPDDALVAAAARIALDALT